MENIKSQIRIGDMGYFIDEIKYIKKGDLVLTYEVENDNSNFIYDVRTGNVHVFPIFHWRFQKGLITNFMKLEINYA